MKTPSRAAADLPDATAERGDVAEPGESASEFLSRQTQSLTRRLSALSKREEELRVREALVSASETRSLDLQEANAHLVMATLAAEQLEHAATKTKRQQDEFVAMLAHELRNPLAPIRNAAALLGKLDAIDPRLKAIREVVQRQVGHMARLLDDLLDASRVTSGKVNLQRRPTILREFVDQAVETCRALIDTHHQALTLDLPITPIYIDGDPSRLTQIVGNLLHNASKYTPDGGAIAVTARLEVESVVIKVTDAGSGISSDSRSHIFELFGQEDRSLSRSQGGLGIGLTVVRSMVELHGGTVAVSSDGVGMGSEFTVVLPRMDYVAESALQPNLPVAFAPARILLIEDNVDAGTTLCRLLQMSGYEVEVAVDGPSGLAGFQRRRPQIVVCDIGLPGMDGYEVATKIRQESNGESFHPVLIALTGYDGASDRAKALACGFDRHLAKPVEFDVLLDLIRHADLERG